MPTSAATSGDLATATQLESLDGLIGLDTSTATPVLVGADRTRSARGDVPAGTVHLGIAPTRTGVSRSAARRSPVRPAFGVTSAYDVAAGGEGTLDYRTGTGRRAAPLFVGLAWSATVLAASRLGVPSVLRRSRTRDETLLDLDREPGAVDLAELDQPAGDRTGFAGGSTSWNRPCQPNLPNQTSSMPGEWAPLAPLVPIDFGEAAVSPERAAADDVDEDDMWTVGRERSADRRRR